VFGGVAGEFCRFVSVSVVQFLTERVLELFGDAFKYGCLCTDTPTAEAGSFQVPVAGERRDVERVPLWQILQLFYRGSAVSVPAVGPAALSER
jgi:hypothetical protein